MIPKRTKSRRFIAKFTYCDLSTYLGVSEPYLRQLVHNEKLNLRNIADLHTMLNFITAKQRIKHRDMSVSAAEPSTLTTTLNPRLPTRVG